MKSPRRELLRLASGAAALSALSRVASAQAYPARPVRWVVGFAPAGGNDIVARLMGQWLSERTGQQFIVENRPGAATNIATEIVVNAPARWLHAPFGRCVGAPSMRPSTTISASISSATSRRPRGS